jgi:hypothetical protein
MDDLMFKKSRLSLSECEPTDEPFISSIDNEYHPFDDKCYGCLIRKLMNEMFRGKDEEEVEDIFTKIVYDQLDIEKEGSESSVISNNRYIHIVAISIKKTKRLVTQRDSNLILKVILLIFCSCY